MLELTIILSVVFLFLLFYEEDRAKSLIFGGLSIFLAYGGYRLSYDGTNYQYAFIPLAIGILSTVWSINIAYQAIVEASKVNWGKQVDKTEE